MATTNKNIPENYSKLDYSEIKEQIKTHLATKTEFQDFNFEGPAISLLIDSLAHTSHMLSVYANMAMSESFIDSSQLRSSVVSHAKALGYIPRSATSPRAKLTLTLVHPSGTTGISDLVIPRGTRFSTQSSSNQDSFTFVTVDNYTMSEELDENGAVINPGTYIAEVEIFEGEFVKEEKELTLNMLRSKIPISNRNIDTRYIFVNTKASATSTEKTRWSQFLNIVNVGPDDRVFFLQENAVGRYEVYFGDDIIGKRPDVGTVLELQYLWTHGPAANGANTFELIDKIKTSTETFAPSEFNLVVDENANHGAPRESIEQIKHIAPKLYRSQNRAVTKADYLAILQSEYGFIESISVWGGEDNVPPIYGRIFISIKPTFGTLLSPITKKEIEDNIFEKFSIIGITPVIVDPNIIQVDVASTIKYNRDESSLTSGELKNAINSSIRNFFVNEVSGFNSTLRFSRLLSAIDNTSSAILGNTTKLTLNKKLIPDPNILKQILFGYSNPVERGSLRTNMFKNLAGVDVQIKDNGEGRLDSYVNDRIRASDIGSIDYDKGEVEINSYIFEVPDNTEVVFSADPSNQDIDTVNNNLLILRNSNIELVLGD